MIRLCPTWTDCSCTSTVPSPAWLSMQRQLPLTLPVNQKSDILTEKIEEAAHLRIADLLRSPEDLTNKLPGIRRKCGKEGPSIEAQIENNRLCADAQSSVSNFSKLEKTNGHFLRDTFKRFITSQISKSHQNFKRTKEVIDNFQQLSKNVTRVHQLLEADSKDSQGSADNLLLIHYQLFQLESFRHETLQKARGFSTDVMNTLNTYFRVDELASPFEAFLWQLAKNGNPSTVLRLVKIIEMEERADEIAALLEVGDSCSRPIKSYRIKFFDVIREGISEQMANIYNDFKGDVPKLMWGMDKAVDDLVVIHDELVPVFAKRYNIFQFFVLQCHRNVYEVVNRMIHGPMDAGAILRFLKWARDYYSNMSGRLLGEELIEPRLLDGNEEELIGSIIVFQMFNQQLDIVQNSFRGQLLTDVQFQMTWTEVPDGEHTKFLAKSPDLTLGIVEYICALANDSMRSTEFSYAINACFMTLADASQRHQRDGFMKLAEHCYTGVIDIMLTDAKPAFSKLHCPEWYEQYLMKLVIGTLEDYSDLMDRAKYRMPAAIDRLKSDQTLALEFFSKYKSTKRVKASFNVIEKRVAMLETNVFLDFYALWRAYPDIPIPMVEDLFGKRHDLGRTTLKEMIENVRQKPSIFSRLSAK
ncbi:exocyst complex component Sec6-domain-containing protein [Cladochytrium replicatum]|nr:exocyst complex component Sec6-domain-containing protein [Cladochytrium replicatum]